jgi:uncharacterized protein YerC
VQVSSQRLSLKKQNKLLEQLLVVIGDLSHPNDVSLFATNFFTPTEINVFSKRLAIIWSLKQGESYEDIKKNLHVSSATISSLSEIANTPAINKVVKIIERDQKISGWLDMIFGKKK